MLLTTSWIVPVVAPPIRNGLVAIDDGTITWVGRADDPSRPGGEVHDLGPGVLLPGFVNAHCHLELTHLAGLDGDGFVGWVSRLVAERTRQGREPSRAGAARGISALAETATVAVGDVSNELGHLDLLADAPIDAVVFYEQLAWDPGRAETVLLSAEARMRVIDPFLSSRGVHVRLGAHAPHSVSPELLTRMAQRGGPAFIHLAESPAEVEFLATGTGAWAGFLRDRVGEVSFAPPGTTPVRYLDGLGVLHAGLVAAHCVQVDAADRALLAARGVKAVLCPSSNRRLGVGWPDLPALLADGVAIALGTDSAASGDSLDVHREAVLLRERFPSVPAEALVRALTLGGAEALGLPHLGAVHPGRSDRLAFVPAPSVPGDPYEHVLAPEAHPRRAGGIHLRREVTS